MMKRALSGLLATLMLVSALGTPALAAGTGYEGKTVILYTGNLRGEVDLYPQIAQAKRDLEEQGADVLLVDVGNYLQGSAIANATRGGAIYDLMTAAGYDVAGMGLAEFGYTDALTGYPYHGNVTRYHTQSQLQEGCGETVYNVNRDGSQTATLSAREPAGFQTVCSNVLPLAEGVYSYQNAVDVTTEGGLTLRFQGLADPAVAENVQDGFVVLREPAATLDSFADLTVTLSNDPASLQTAENGITIAVSAGGEPTVGACVIDNDTHTVTFEEVELERTDEAVAQLAASLKAQEVETLGTSQVVLNGSDRANWNGETNLGDLTTDALKWYAETYIDGVDKTYPVVALQNGGNCDAFLYTGAVTEVDLLKALPFSPMGIGVLQVSGQTLLETLEAASQTEDCPGFAQVAGLKYTLELSQDYDGGAAYGKYYEADSVNRVTITEVGGQPFDPDATYNLVCDNFLMNGNDTYYTLKNAKEAPGAKYVNNGGGVKTRDVVAMYIDQVLSGVIGETYAAPQGRITVTEDVLAQFDDLAPNAWYTEAVRFCVERGILKGTGKGFEPDATLTYEQVLQTLYNLEGNPAVTGTALQTPAGAWYADAVNWAVASNIIYFGDTFTEGSPCLRVSTAEMLYNYCQYVKGTPMVHTASIESAPDYDLIYRTSVPAVSFCAAAGLMTGNERGELMPYAPLTRAQWAQIMWNLDAFLADPSAFETQEPVQEPTPDPVVEEPAQEDALTEETVLAAINALREEYPEGMHWTNDDGHYSSALYTMGYGCEAFALICSDAAFGDLPLSSTHAEFNAIRVGDLLRINHNTHTVIVLEKKDNSVVVAEGNYNSSIHWGREISRQSLEAGDYTVRSRYPQEGTAN